MHFITIAEHICHRLPKPVANWNNDWLDDLQIRPYGRMFKVAASAALAQGCVPRCRPPKDCDTHIYKQLKSALNICSCSIKYLPS